ncbi:glycerol-3-phosphate 1-O-acyltransferase PlsY [Methylococcus geothermalis]|uniref:Glycerol-3-phosphate acyltransferase n=1 Tax=Methylococcus geothermalis TaxID=2681310 RepID=A0A858Q5E4_9GAMM|nr:glycerol-3-phosphate 1-O-acyltransferase PlsY [Methylococcus geothermalis]QJD29072.1 glycerol-3-phosphate 1-O-acyltransferase PlsY [Methylococcus geothermalis]
MLIEWLLIPFAYLLGSVSSAVIVSRALGLPDPRQEGSKNPGATNVLRLGGKQAAILTLLGDASKGLVPLLIAKSVGASPPLMAAVGFAAFVGHLYPVFFQFKGGKGVATALGVLLGFAWPVGVMALLTWLGVAALFRFSSLAALAAAVLAPVYVWFWLGSAELVVSTMFMSTLLVYRHKSNIERLLKGEETRLGARRP